MIYNFVFPRPIRNHVDRSAKQLVSADMYKAHEPLVMEYAVIAAIVEAGGILDFNTESGKRCVERALAKLGYEFSGPRAQVCRKVCSARYRLARRGVLLPTEKLGKGIWVIDLLGSMKRRRKSIVSENDFQGVYLYFFPEFPEKMKIGWADRVFQRASQLVQDGRSAGIPSKPELVWVVRCENPREVEGLLKYYFKTHGKHAQEDAGTEWFHISREEFEEAVSRLTPDYEQGPPSMFLGSSSQRIR